MCVWGINCTWASGGVWLCMFCLLRDSLSSLLFIFWFHISAPLRWARWSVNGDDVEPWWCPISPQARLTQESISSTNQQREPRTWKAAILTFSILGSFHPQQGFLIWNLISPLDFSSIPDWAQILHAHSLRWALKSCCITQKCYTWFVTVAPSVDMSKNRLLILW